MGRLAYSKLAERGIKRSIERGELLYKLRKGVIMVSNFITCIVLHHTQSKVSQLRRPFLPANIFLYNFQFFLDISIIRVTEKHKDLCFDAKLFLLV